MEMELSKELEAFMEAHQIPDVPALLAISPETLLTMEGFGWRLMKEVLKLGAIE
ncbi:hypothetical protein RCH33_939 [Flavobacterium daejeonense]|nr:hypothetical protein RCH33_939 [Flavobacterium daejeonense]